MGVDNCVDQPPSDSPRSSGGELRWPLIWSNMIGYSKVNAYGGGRPHEIQTVGYKKAGSSQGFPGSTRRVGDGISAASLSLPGGC